MTLNLMLHCGGAEILPHDLEQVPTPPSTDSWMPIPHHMLLQGVVQTLEQSGLQITSEAHAIARDGNRYFGLLELHSPDSDDYALVVGIRNSHDKSFPAGLAVGSGVFVCDNLAFSSEVVLSRKHTVHIQRDLPQLIERAVGELGSLRVDQARRIEAYKQKRLNDAHAHHLLIQAIDSRVLPVTRLKSALQEWREPSYPEFAEQGKTAWRLFNACTESIKGRSLDELPRRTQALHGLVDKFCHLNYPPRNISAPAKIYLYKQGALRCFN